MRHGAVRGPQADSTAGAHSKHLAVLGFQGGVTPFRILIHTFRSQAMGVAGLLAMGVAGFVGNGTGVKHVCCPVFCLDTTAV